MGYFFMFLWFIFGTVFLISLVYWLIKKRNGKWVLYSLGLSILCLIIGVAILPREPSSNAAQPTQTNNNQSVTETASTDDQEIATAFEERSWNEFLQLYDAHNNLMAAMNAYAEGKISALDFYDYCKKAEEWFREASLNFGYGKTKDEKEYLATYQTFALADQQATKSLMKYIDSGSTKDLSRAREEINRAKEAATIISGNRVVLLRKMGLTEDEINAKVEQMVADIEAIDNRK